MRAIHCEITEEIMDKGEICKCLHTKSNHPYGKCLDCECSEYRYYTFLDGYVPDQVDKWDKYFLRQTKEIASLSPDKSTKCGACLIKDRHLISQGFNGPAKRLKDDLIPTTRPLKYEFMYHAEKNTILSCCERIDSSYIMFVSSKPCWQCIQLMYHCGIRQCVYTNYSLPKMCNEEDTRMREWFLSLCLDEFKMRFIDKKELYDKIC